MNRTDPSGYRSLGDIFKQAFFLGPHILTDPMYWASPKTFNQYYGQAAGIAATAIVLYYTGSRELAGAAGGFVSGFSSSLLNGGSVGDAFRSGIIGAGVGVVSGYVGSIGNVYARVAANAVLGGAITEAQGGEFRHGFYASLATSAMAPSIRAAASQNWYAGLVMSAVVGGTASEISGGKFANGAYTGAFQYVIMNYPSRNTDRGARAAVGLAKSSDFPASSPEEEQKLMEKSRQMALQTTNGKKLLPYIEGKGYHYQWTNGDDGGYDPIDKIIKIPRSYWQDAAWTMIHESVHVIEDATGRYSSDKGWAMFRLGEIRAYSAELNAYREYRALPGHADYSTPGMEAIRYLWNDPKAFNSFIDDTYKSNWENIVNGVNR
jgi:hypothetical protein